MSTVLVALSKNVLQHANRMRGCFLDVEDPHALQRLALACCYDHLYKQVFSIPISKMHDFVQELACALHMQLCEPTASGKLLHSVDAMQHAWLAPPFCAAYLMRAQILIHTQKKKKKKKKKVFTSTCDKLMKSYRRCSPGRMSYMQPAIAQCCTSRACRKASAGAFD